MEPTEFSKKFIRDFMQVLDSVHYELEVLRDPKRSKHETIRLELKEIILRDIVERIENGNMSEFIFDAMSPDLKSRCLFHFADQNNQEIFRRMINKCSVTTCNDEGEAILNYATKRGQFDIIKILLQDQEIKEVINDYDGEVRLLWYIMSKACKDTCAMDIVEKFIAAGADGILAIDSGGVVKTAWHPCDASLWDMKRERKLYDKLANILICSELTNLYINEPDSKGETALHRAIRLCKLETVEKMINSGASVQYINPQTGKNVLHLAKYPEIVELLIAKGANIHINSADLEGRSPLHQAVMQDRVKVAKALIQNGADLNIHDNSNKNVLHLLPQNSKNGAAMLELFAGVRSE